MNSRKKMKKVCMVRDEHAFWTMIQAKNPEGIIIDELRIEASLDTEQECYKLAQWEFELGERGYLITTSSSCQWRGIHETPEESKEDFVDWLDLSYIQRG